MTLEKKIREDTDLVMESVVQQFGLGRANKYNPELYKHARDVVIEHYQQLELPLVYERQTSS